MYGGKNEKSLFLILNDTILPRMVGLAENINFKMGLDFFLWNFIKENLS